MTESKEDQVKIKEIINRIEELETEYQIPMIEKACARYKTWALKRRQLTTKKIQLQKELAEIDKELK